MKGKVCATLSVFSEDPGFFQDKELTLLTEAAVELSFALDSLAHQEERLQAEAGVEREKRFADTLIETTPGIFYRSIAWSSDGRSDPALRPLVRRSFRPM